MVTDVADVIARMQDLSAVRPARLLLLLLPPPPPPHQRQLG